MKIELTIERTDCVTFNNIFIKYFPCINNSVAEEFFLHSNLVLDLLIFDELLTAKFRWR